MKNILKNLVNLIDFPALVIDKKQKLIANNQYANWLVDISKNIELKKRIEDFIANPDKYITLLKDKSRYIKMLSNNEKLLNLILVLEELGYKVTHITSTNLNVDDSIVNIIIFRVFFHKNQEFFVILVETDLFSLIKKFVKLERNQDFDEINQKYTVLLKVINRVFSVVKGFTETIIFGNYNDMDLVLKMVNIIDNEVANGLKIILSLNLSDNIGNVNIQNISLNNFLSNLISNFSQKIINNNLNINFEYYIQPNIPDIYTDPSKLELCLLNLLDNAIRFRDDSKSEILIKFSAFFESKDSKIKIVVEDNGIGMDREEIEQLGQIFKTFSEKSGIGLGFYIINKIVKAMKWNIIIDSRKGKYTKVTLEIPYV